MLRGWRLGVVPLVVGATAAALGGCDDGIDLPTQRVFASEHFAYFARADDPKPCPALADVFEQHFRAVQAYLGLVPWPADRVIPYYKFVDGGDATRSSGCPVRSACAGHDVRSYETFHEHELIHAYLFSFGEPPALFQEGIAVVLACDSAFADAMPMPWADAVRSNDALHETGIYVTGAILVKYLLMTQGAAPFMQLYGELPHGAAPDVVDAAIQRIYGSSADELWQLALAAPRGCIPVGRCARDEIPVDGTPSAVGDVCGLDFDRRTFTIPAAGNVTVGTSANLSFSLGSCDQTSHWLREGFQDSPGVGFNPGAPLPPNLALTELGAGRYFVEFSNQPADLAVTAPLQPWAAPSCDGARPLSIAPTGSLYPGLRIIPPAGTAEWIVRLQIEGGAHAFGVQPNRVGVTACPSCDLAAPSCQSSSYDPFELASTSAVFLRLVPAAPDPTHTETIAVDLVPR